MWIHAHLSSCMNLVRAYMLHRKNKGTRKYFSRKKNCCMMSVHWHHTEWERIPGCIALVIFSSNRTGYHPHSQHCWRVCAPFRADLNKTGKLTQSLLRCMNINVTSDRVEWQTGNIDSLWVLGRDKLFPFERTWCFSQYEHEWSTYSPRS